MIYFRISLRADSLEEMLTSSWWYMSISFIEIPAAILAIIVVRTIDRRQITKSRLITPLMATVKHQNRGDTTMKKMVFIILACLLAGTGLGYFLGYINFVPVLENYVAQINNQNNEISRLVQINCNLEQTVTNQETIMQDQESQIGGLVTQSANFKTQISSLEAQYTSLESDLTEAQEQIDDYQQELSEKSKNIISLGNRLNEVLSIDIPQYYKWNYNGTRELDVDITLSSYVDCYDKPRPRDIAGLVDMIKESKSDPTIKSLVGQLREIADTKRMGDRQLADYVASFVQSMPYTTDYDTTGRDEYPRYPVETLFKRGGDCEDTSVLIATLLDGLGINVVLLHLEGEQHIALGVDVPKSYGIYYEYIGTKYWFLETTAEGWRVGDFPTEFKDDKAYIYPVW